MNKIIFARISSIRIILITFNNTYLYMIEVFRVLFESIYSVYFSLVQLLVNGSFTANQGRDKQKSVYSALLFMHQRDVGQSL
jgi:hypothetical protein